jgi:hypothetical protein
MHSTHADSAAPPVNVRRSLARTVGLPVPFTGHDASAPPVRRWESGGTAWTDIESVFFGSGYSDCFAVPWAPRQSELDHPLLSALRPEGGLSASWDRLAAAPAPKRRLLLAAAMVLVSAFALQIGAVSAVVG